MKPLQPLAFFLAVSLLVAVGCVPVSIHPLYSGPEEVAFDPALLGAWESDWGRWTFERSDGFERSDDGDFYLIHQQPNDENKPAAFLRGALVEIDGRQFLNLYPLAQQPDLKINGWYGMHYFPPKHTFLRVWVDEGQIQLGLLDLKRVTALLKEQPDAVRHELVDVQVQKGDDPVTIPLLLAESEQLRAFVRAHLADEMFKNRATLTRPAQ